MTPTRMNPRSTLAALAIATGMAVTLAAPLPVFAQATATEEASESQLDMSVEQVFEQLGITTEVQALSLSQLAAIHGIISDESGSGNEKQKIEAIIANN